MAGGEHVHECVSGREEEKERMKQTTKRRVLLQAVVAVLAEEADPALGPPCD